METEEEAPSLDAQFLTEKKNCTLCEALGRKVASKKHPLDLCYAYPKGKTFRFNLWKARVMEAVSRGDGLPALLKEGMEDHFNEAGELVTPPEKAGTAAG